MENENIKKEYAIYCIYNGGTPFILHTYKSLQEAKLQIYNMAYNEIDHNRIFYVDNDFYENKYPNYLNREILQDFRAYNRRLGNISRT